MDDRRREVLRAGGGIGLIAVLGAIGLVRPGQVLAAERALFEAGSLDEAFAALGAGRPADSGEIEISAPDVAENGAMVSIGVASRLADTDRIVILVEKNPNLVVADFSVPAGTIPDIQTRVKMAETSDVYVVVRAGGRLHVARRNVRVTQGGCAG